MNGRGLRSPDWAWGQSFDHPHETSRQNPFAAVNDRWLWSPDWARHDTARLELETGDAEIG